MKDLGSVCTPLMIAAHKGDMEAVVMLLEAKPDVAIKSSYAALYNSNIFTSSVLMPPLSEGKTAADIAADNGHSQISQILQEILSHGGEA
jgi:ankyrin repeat protein